jgi:hypothetical protein
VTALGGPSNVGLFRRQKEIPMRSSLRFLMRPLSTARFDDRLTQTLCYAASLTILVLGGLKLSRLGLDEAHLFLGALQVFALTILGAIAGTMASRSRKAA